MPLPHIYCRRGKPPRLDACLLKTTLDSERSTLKAVSKSPARKSARPTASKPPARKTAAKKGAAAGKASARGSKGKAPAGKTAAKKPAARKTTAARPAARPAARKAPVDKGPEALAPVVATLRRSVLGALDEMKAKDVVEIDIRGKASFADLLFIASGTSSRHVKSLADEVVKFVKKAGMMPLGVEGQKEAEWVLVDLGDIVCHIMLPRIREFYALERLWSVGGEQDAETTD
jgi:ribosome silencing factor RsfS/YbeB/iojap